MFATIDIGTNSVLLLIGEPEPHGNVRVVEDRAVVTRLGAGLSASGKISDEAAERTLNTLGDYWELCVRHGVKSVATVGTAAFRKASNAGDFLLIAKRTLRLDIEIIPEEREASLTYLACTRDFGKNIVVVDIGGGSTEIMGPAPEDRPDSGRLIFKSLPIGSVSLTERFLHSDPPALGEIHNLRLAIHEELENDLDPAIFSRPHDRRFVAAAGTATTLMAMNLGLLQYDPAAVHGKGLKIDDLRGIIDAMKTKTIEERKKMPGLIPERADVIVAGAELLQETMSVLGYANATISDRGVKWGLFYEKFCS